ncbi:unnamed protein product [Malus baccata var. baccata]
MPNKKKSAKHQSLSLFLFPKIHLFLSNPLQVLAFCSPLPNPKARTPAQNPIQSVAISRFSGNRYAEAMSTEKMPQKKERPQIVKLDKALDLAKKWLNTMSEPAEDEPFEIQARPARQVDLFIYFVLGLGAVAPRPSKFVPSNDPLERKLHYKLDAARRNAAKIAEESTLAAKDDDDNDDEDSRTSAFAKKRPAAPVTPSLRAKKRQK